MAAIGESANLEKFLSDSSFLVLGAGVSGKAAARALFHRGAKVCVAVPTATPDSEELARSGIDVCIGDLAATVLAEANRASRLVVVPSPGIAPSSEAFAIARAAGATIIGELELGAMLFGGRVIAVSGSKGKSSLVKFIADALSRSGHSAVPCGNYGKAFCAVSQDASVPEFAVVECSSFQLETLGSAFKPEAAILLNLSRDHLNRHGTMQAYLEAKLEMFRNCDSDCHAFVPASDSWNIREELIARYPALKFTAFGAGENSSFYYSDGVVQTPSGEAISVADSYFDNLVLGDAAAAACGLLSWLGLNRDAIEASFRSFQPLPHRMQLIRTIHGVAWVNNSKATNLEALVASVKMARKPVYLIAGGILKEPLSVDGNLLLENGVAKVYTIGQCGALMAQQWSQILPTEYCEALPAAVAAAAKDSAMGGKGGTVLLAPGTASFDQFQNFEARGDAFANLATAIAGQ